MIDNKRCFITHNSNTFENLFESQSLDVIYIVIVSDNKPCTPITRVSHIVVLRCIMQRWDETAGRNPCEQYCL